jgi:hypothetical protein
MNFDPFNRLPTQAIAILHDAYKAKDSGWTNLNYKAAYCAFCAETANHVDADKFDALVRWWGDTNRHKSTRFEKDRRGSWRMAPNKMMTSPAAVKKSLVSGSFDDLHRAMMGDNLR